MDSTGPVAIVTGSNTGIGYHTARGLALKGYTVILATRSRQLGVEAAERITRDIAQASAGESRSFLDGGSVHTGCALCLPVDVSSLASVKAFADGLPPSLTARLRVLVLNAGISGLGLGGRRLTEDSVETVFATNFVGHFYLVQLLQDHLKLAASSAAFGPPSRIVALASVTHRLVPTTPPDWSSVLLGTAPRGYQYAYSKLAALLLAGELNRTVLLGSGVSAVAVNPGAVNSDIWRAISPATACWFRPLMRLTFLTPQQGAATSIAAATERAVQGVNLDVQYSGGEGGSSSSSSSGSGNGSSSISSSSRAPPTVYLSPYSSSQWAQKQGGWMAVLGDLIGPFRGANAMLPTELALNAKCARDLWAVCEAAIARKQGL